MKGFAGKRTVRSYTMHIEAPPDAVFPLLCPTKEYEWIDRWECKMVYSDSGFADLDCIFETNFPGEGPDIWVISRYEPPAEIQFIRVNDSRAMRFSISLSDGGTGTTRAVWKQVVTGLTPEGNKLVETLSDEQYATEMKTLELKVNHFLRTGNMLPWG